MTRKPPPPPDAEWLKVSEIAARMRLSKMTIYRLVHSGELPSIRVGRTFRVAASRVDAYLAAGGSPTPQQTPAPKPKPEPGGLCNVLLKCGDVIAATRLAPGALYECDRHGDQGAVKVGAAGAQ